MRPQPTAMLLRGFNWGTTGDTAPSQHRELRGAARRILCVRRGSFGRPAEGASTTLHPRQRGLQRLCEQETVCVGPQHLRRLE